MTAFWSASKPHLLSDLADLIDSCLFSLVRVTAVIDLLSVIHVFELNSGLQYWKRIHHIVAKPNIRLGDKKCPECSELCSLECGLVTKMLPF